MPDRLTIEQRHKNMAAIRAKGTKPEMIVRKYLWSHGFRYRLNHPRLPGKPDIVLRSYRTCIFVNGCFWHGHNVDVPYGMYNVPLDALQNSECCKIPMTNREFWVRKITRNRERDQEVQHQLTRMGWNCITIWECQLRPACRQATLDSLALTLSQILLKDHKIKRYESEESEPRMVADDGEE